MHGSKKKGGEPYSSWYLEQNSPPGASGETRRKAVLGRGGTSGANNGVGDAAPDRPRAMPKTGRVRDRIPMPKDP